MPPATGHVRPGVVDLLADVDYAQADTSSWPWQRLVHLDSGEPFTAAEESTVATANEPELVAAHELARATERRLRGRLADLQRLQALTSPYAMPWDEDLVDTVLRLPEGPERGEAIRLLRQYPDEAGIDVADLDEVLAGM